MPSRSPSPKSRSSRDRSPGRGAASTSVRWRRDVPEAIRRLDTLDRVNYADIVTATVGEASVTSPEKWMRTTLKGAPRGLLPLVPLIQRFVLGLRLESRPSPDNLLGWKIADRDEKSIRLEASSWLLTGHILIHVDRGRLSFATFLRYDHPLAALIWPPVSLIHRQVALTIVRRAASAI